MAKYALATILFADLLNPDELVKKLSLEEYDDMIVDFQNTMSLVASNHLRDFGYVGIGMDSEWSVVGDELRVYLYSGDLRFDIRNALQLAVKLKLGWLASAFNQGILMEGRPVSRLSIGINCEEVTQDTTQKQIRAKRGQHPIDKFPIHLTKQIEAIAREGKVYQVMVEEKVFQFCSMDDRINVAFGQPLHGVLKGKEKNKAVYEVISFINYEIVSTMPDLFQDRLQETMEYAIAHSVPEPWIFFTLLRHYISKIRGGDSDELAPKAVMLADQALGFLEHKKTIYNILGWLYTNCEKIRDLEMALHYFNKTLDVAPNDEAALIHRGRISEEKGNIELARRSYERILGRKPDHPEAVKKLARYDGMYPDPEV